MLLWEWGLAYDAMLQALWDIFFPPSCITCGEELVSGEELICTHCRHQLPLVEINSLKDNPVSRVFEGLLPLTYAFSLFYFKKSGITSELIYALKYKGGQEVGTFAGSWIGEILNTYAEFQEIDVIIPVPLHPKKKRERGYNQLSLFGKTLAKYLHVPYWEEALIRRVHTPSQTKKNRIERFSKVADTYAVNPGFKERLLNKHVLLIDDVITTGATLETCGLALLEIPDTQVSVCSIALAHHL